MKKPLGRFSVLAAGVPECANTLTHLTNQPLTEIDMANTSLNRPAVALKPTLCDSLITSLEKAKALVEVATFEPFTGCRKSTIHNYICTLGELIDNAITASDELCKRDLKGNSGDIKAD